MKQTITESYFIDQIVGDEYNSMTYDGAKALFEFLEDCGMDSDEVEFDKVAIRCQFTEYDNLDEIMDQYDSIKSLSDLHDNTMVIEIPKSERLIISEF